MTCPQCGGKTAAKYRPFCSKRCANVDLSRWLNETYSVPSEDVHDIEDALEQAEQKTQRPH